MPYKYRYQLTAFDKARGELAIRYWSNEAQNAYAGQDVYEVFQLPNQSVLITACGEIIQDGTSAEAEEFFNELWRELENE